MSRALSLSATLEILARLSRDRRALARRFFDGVAPGPVVRLTGLGDPHRGGRRVARVRFRSGRTLIIKPRSIEPERLWNRAAEWIGARAASGPFLIPVTWPKPRSGWVEDLPARPPRTDDQASAFYRRAGTLLALMDVLEVRDAHRDNFLAVGPHPVLVDAEAIAHHRFPRFLRTPSLALTGFLPAPGQRHGGGLLIGLPSPGVRPIRYQEELVAGYRDGFGILRRHGAELLRPGGPLHRIADTPVRIVLRPTAWYREALRAPDRWHDPSLAPLPVPGPGRAAVERLEREALERGDVPVFHALAGGTDLLADDRIVIRGCFASSGLERIADRLASLGPAGERRAVDLIRSALALDEWTAALGRGARDRSGRRARSR